MEKVYIYNKKDLNYTSCYLYRKRQTIIIYVLCIALLIISYLILQGATATLREELIFQLSKERDVLRANQSLKVELSGITKKRYLELKAQEIGLKKPKEEEVLVLR